MRPQGAWLRIIALLALLALVLPASAKVAMCMGHAKSMTRCMKQIAPSAKPKAVEVKEGCCHAKARSAKSEPGISEVKGQCHCSIKSIPSQVTNDFVAVSGSENLDFTATVQTDFSPNSGTVARVTQTIFYGDSSPPDEPHGSATRGRAPPCFCSLTLPATICLEASSFDVT